MSDSNPSDLESSQDRKKLRNSNSSEATPFFGSFSEFGESNIGSTVNEGQEKPFHFGTTAANYDLVRELPSPLTTAPGPNSNSSEATGSFGSSSEFGESNIGNTVDGRQERSFFFIYTGILKPKSPPSNAPKPTSCCQSPVPEAQLGASNKNLGCSSSSIRASTSDPKQSHLPGKKPTSAQTPQSGSPSEKLTPGGKIISPFDQITTLSVGSLFSGSSSQPCYPRNTLTVGSSFSGSSSELYKERYTLSVGSLFSGSSSQPSMFLSSPKQSSQPGKVAEVGTENVDDEDEALAKLPEYHYREQLWSSSTSSSTSNSFNNGHPFSLSFQFRLQNFSGTSFFAFSQQRPRIPVSIVFPRSEFPFPETSTGV